MSVGLTCVTDSKMTWEQTPGWTWRGATGAGCAAAAGGAGVPIGTGVAFPYTTTLDIRLEYEYVGSNQIGIFPGTSLTNGFLQTITTVAPYGSMGPASCWPQLGSARLGHCPMNGGVGGASAPVFTSAAAIAWTRFLSPESGQTAFACTPDYAVIDLGINDSASALANGTLPYTLAQLQTNVLAIIAILQGFGINKILIATCPPGFLTEFFGSLTTFQTGILATAIPPGATLAIVMNAAGANAGASPGGGYPGLAGAWFDAGNAGAVKGQAWVGLPSSGVPGTSVGKGAGEGPCTITSVAGFPTLTITSFTFLNTHAVGEPVFATREGYRQQYNYWMRCGVPGTIGTIDMARVCEIPAGAAALGVTQKHPYFYGDVDDIHPNTPAMYHAMAREFVVNVAGI